MDIHKGFIMGIWPQAIVEAPGEVAASETHTGSWSQQGRQSGKMVVNWEIKDKLELRSTRTHTGLSPAEPVTLVTGVLQEELVLFVT